MATKTAEQLDLQALHRARAGLVSQRTGIINQIRAFLLDRGVAIRQSLRFLRAELPRILATPPDVLAPRMVCVIEVWLKIGAGSMSVLVTYPTRSQPRLRLAFAPVYGCIVRKNSAARLLYRRQTVRVDAAALRFCAKSSHCD